MMGLPSAEELALDIIEVVVKPIRHKQLGIVKIIRTDRNAVLEAAAEVADAYGSLADPSLSEQIAAAIRALKVDT